MAKLPCRQRENLDSCQEEESNPLGTRELVIDEEVFWHPPTLADAPAGPANAVLAGYHMPMSLRLFDPTVKMAPSFTTLTPREEESLPFARLFTRSFEERTLWFMPNGRYDTASQTYHSDGVQIYCDGGGGGYTTCPQWVYTPTSSGDCNTKEDESDNPTLVEVPD